MSWINRILGKQPSSGLSPTPFVPTHRHRKGGAYRFLGEAILEADRSTVAIYDDAEGNVWVRSIKEFKDGRFTPIS